MFFLLFLFPPYSRNCFQSGSVQHLANQSGVEPRRVQLSATTAPLTSPIVLTLQRVFVPGVASKMLTFNKYLRKLARRRWLSRRLLEPWVSSRASCTAGGKKKEAGKLGVVCSCPNQSVINPFETSASHDTTKAFHTNNSPVLTARPQCWF